MMSKSCKSVCHPRNVVSIALLSLSFIFLSLITIISSETIAKVPDFESNTGLNNIYRSSESNVIHKNPLRNNLANLRGILSKRANIRYLRNVLDALDTKLEKFQDSILRDVRQKRVPECLSGLPGADCDNNQMGLESLGQGYLRPGGRNPGR